MLDARVVAERRQRLARLKAVREQERAVARRTVRQFEAAKAAAVASTCATRRIEWESEKWAAVDELNGRCQAGLHCYGAAQSASDGAVKALRTAAHQQADVWEQVAVAQYQRGRLADRVEHVALAHLPPAREAKRATHRRGAAVVEGATARATQRQRKAHARATARAERAARPRPAVITKEISPAEQRRREVTYRQRDFSRTRFHSRGGAPSAARRVRAAPVVSVSRHTAAARENADVNRVDDAKRAAMESTRARAKGVEKARVRARGSAAIKWESESHGINATMRSLHELQRADRKQQAEGAASASRSFIVHGKSTTEHFTRNQRAIERVFEETFLNVL